MKTCGFFSKFVTIAVTFAAGALALSGRVGGGADGTSSSDSGAAVSNGGKVKVGAMMPTRTSERWIIDGNAAKEGLEAAGYEVDPQFTSGDIPTRTQQIDQMITNGATILVIASVDGTALSSRLDTAGLKNIPVIAYDRLIRDNENVDFYVPSDNFKVGVAQGNAPLYGLGLTDKDGKKLDSAPKGPLNIELFAGSSDDNNAKFFFDGAMSVLKPYLDDGASTVKSGQTSSDQVAILCWQQGAAQKRMEDLLTSTYGGDSEPLAGVLSPLDGISCGIITTLQGAGYGPVIKDGLPIVAGRDAGIASIKMISDGIQQPTVSKDTYTSAAQAMTVIKAMAEGKEPEASDTITHNNDVKAVPPYLLEVETIYVDSLKGKPIDSGYFTQADVDVDVVKK